VKSSLDINLFASKLQILKIRQMFLSHQTVLRSFSCSRHPTYLVPSHFNAQKSLDFIFIARRMFCPAQVTQDKLSRQMS